MRKRKASKKAQRIIAVNDRGQLTIPKSDRESLGTRYFVYMLEKQQIILKPLQTREEFLQELDEAYAEWKEQGGPTLEEIKRKYKL